MTTPKVVFEDKEILVLDKPSGWITNFASTTKGQPVVQSWLAKNFKYPLIGNRRARDGIVHRLDKETSGILLIAKTLKSFESLQKQFKNREVRKAYLALVHGKLEPKQGEVKATVGRLPWRRDRFGVLPGGRDSETKYNVINYYNDNNDCIFTLVGFHPKTGRTHQIRIHAKYLGHPIIGDDFYAGRKTARADRSWCPRLALHAAKISFADPANGKMLEFESPLPKDLRKVIVRLKLIG